MPANVESTSCLRRGRLVWHYDAVHDVVTLSYVDLTLENAGDAAWFDRECETFWRRFHDSMRDRTRTDLLVDMSGIIVKPAAAAGWNATRARVAERYIAKAYRFGGERRTVTAVHLGQVLNKTDGTMYADREHALAALLADRAR